MMKCTECGAELEENDHETEGWIFHKIAAREKTVMWGQPPVMTTKSQSSVWICSLECEREFLKGLYVAAGGVARSLEAIDGLILPPGL